MEKRTFKCEGERNDYMLYYEQVFTVFEMIFQKHTKYKLTVWKFIVRSYDKNDMKEKVNDLVRLHEAMQEKLKAASYSEKIQILTMEPDKWSRMYCSEYFNVFEYLVWTSHEIKNVGGILAKPAPKKEKLSPL